MRLDQYLVDRGLARSRSQAKDFFELGLVKINGASAKKISQKIDENDEVKVLDHPIAKYVSRAGLKLASAIQVLGLELKNLYVLDVGQSTGGFTDCCIQLGAKRVFGIDVGEGQIDQKLRDHSQVKVFEKINAKSLSSYNDVLDLIGQPDIVVMDVSFISITQIIPELAKCFKASGFKLLSLVKPQFELSKQDLNKKGLVKSETLYPEVEKKVKDCMIELGFTSVQYLDSDVPGADGNREFFIYGELL